MRVIVGIPLSIAADLFNCIFLTRDLEQACIQAKPLQRDVFTEPSPAANLPSDTVLDVEQLHHRLVGASSCFRYLLSGVYSWAEYE